MSGIDRISHRQTEAVNDILNIQRVVQKSHISNRVELQRLRVLDSERQRFESESGLGVH